MKVSIIVNSYPGTEKYLEECLESIKAQTVKPFEVIVVLDGYTDPVVSPGATTIIRDKNMGIAYSREEGVRLMRGTHILFVDADDVLIENYLAEMIQMMNWKKADIVYPSCLLWCRWGTEAPKENAFWNAPLKIRMKEMLIENSVIVTSLMKKEVYTKIGGFEPDISIYEDWLFFMKALVLKYKFSRANTYLKYRQRTNSRNRSQDEHKERIMEDIRERIRAFSLQREVTLAHK